MLKIQLLVLLFFWCGILHCQPRIFGTVSGYDSNPLPDAVVTVFQNGVPVDSLRTDKIGYFAFDCLSLVPDAAYEIKVVAHCFDCPSIHFTLTDTANVLLGDMSFSCMKWLHCYKADNTAYFGEQDSKTILNFEVGQLKDLMTEYPTMIIEFSLYQFPEEKERLGKKRLETFRKLLKKEGLDFTRIQFNPEIHYYRPDQLTETQLKSGIFGIVKSM
ncbi:MAG: carboxypeptidase-like regulatory domain-containing protein [Bacteroidota bacterium]